MKIVFASLMEGFNWGGSEELWCKVAFLALKNKNEVHISIKKWEKLHPKMESLIENGAIPHYRTRKHPPRKFIKRQLFKLSNIGFNQEVYNWNFLNSLNPDLILVNLGGPYDIYSNLGLFKYLQKQQIKYFVIQQFNTENYVLLDSMRQMNRSFYSKARIVYFVSNRNKETTERNLVMDISNCKVVSNPANLNQLTLVDYPDWNKTYNLACVARLDAFYKGQDLLIEIFSNPIWKDRNWRLNFYGEGPSELYLKELVQFYGLSEKIHFHGNIDDIRKIWEINHLLIMPSISEGKPLALIEAMLCGRPALVTDVGGNSELVQNEVTGFIALAATKTLISRSLETAWDHRNNWYEMGLKAKQHANRLVDLESFKEIYQDFSVS